MSTNEKASVAMYTALDQKIEEYNAELKKEAPNAKTLADIEQDAKGKVSDIAKELMKEALDSFLAYENPMLEAARQLEIAVPVVKIKKDKDTGAPEEMSRDTKNANINVAALTSLLRKYNKNDGFVNSGVIANGASWLYKSERFAHLMTQRVAKALEVEAGAQKQIKDTYKLSEDAKNADVGSAKDPTSNKQMVALLQTILDAMVFVDNGNGGNLVRCTNKDLAFIEDKFTGRDGKNALAIKVAAGRNICTYIFQVAHALVTGKPYEVSGFKQADGSQAITYKPFRDPLPVSALRVKQEKVENAAA